MDRRILRASVVILMLILVLLPVEMATGQLVTLPKPCQDLAFSTEEDFLTKGPEPVDGNPIISDGDLLSVHTDPSGAVVGLICARNAQLLEAFALRWDLGLDAVDVVSVEPVLVAFSTELDAPAPVGAASPFSAGDLLATNGAVFLNEALTAPWQVGYDIGLDAVHFIGDREAITEFLVAAAEKQVPLAPADLRELFDAFPSVDIWFSTEGTHTSAVAAGFLDGDLLSARNGTIVVAQKDLPDAAVPAGIPLDGVDFGLDGVTADRRGVIEQIRFSTEILFRSEIGFTDGDVLRYANGVVKANPDLVGPFLPAAKMLGLDALHLALDVHIGEIRGAKFHDLDRDSRWGADDPPLAQWEIRLDGVDDLGNKIVDTATTNDNGVYSFTVAGGVYTVTEVCPPTAAWRQTLPAPVGDVCGSGVHSLTVDAGGVYEPYDFGNYLLQVDRSTYLPTVMKSYAQ